MSVMIKEISGNSPVSEDVKSLGSREAALGTQFAENIAEQKKHDDLDISEKQAKNLQNENLSPEKLSLAAQLARRLGLRKHTSQAGSSNKPNNSKDKKKSIFKKLLG